MGSVMCSPAAGRPHLRRRTDVAVAGRRLRAGRAARRGGDGTSVRDEEIPRIALMTAAFFVASLIHVPIGPTSVHLLLNGLLGVIVGRRAPLAVLLGLTLQAVLFGHGGFTTIGVNTCVMALPALGAAWLFGTLRAGIAQCLPSGGIGRR